MERLILYLLGLLLLVDGAADPLPVGSAATYWWSLWFLTCWACCYLLMEPLILYLWGKDKPLAPRRITCWTNRFAPTALDESAALHPPLLMNPLLCTHRCWWAAALHPPLLMEQLLLVASTAVDGAADTCCIHRCWWSSCYLLHPPLFWAKIKS